MVEQPKLPKIVDAGIFDVAPIERDIKVFDIDIEDKYQLRVLEVPDVYSDFASVRQFALELPCILARHIYASTAYPGYRGHYICNQTPLWVLLEELFLTYYHDEWVEHRKPLGFPFQTGIINSGFISRRTTIEQPLGSFLPHTDSHPDSYGEWAGLIYLNLPKECAGGTSFYKYTDATGIEKIHEVKMTSNTMVLYQKRIPHDGDVFYDDWKDTFRITQTFFTGINMVSMAL